MRDRSISLSTRSMGGSIRCATPRRRGEDLTARREPRTGPGVAALERPTCSMKVAGDSQGSWSTGDVESTAADHAQLSRRQRCQSVQNAAHKRPQMNHAVRRRSNDHDAQSKGSPILLVLKTSIHTQQDIETPLGTPKQLPVRRPRPACGLHGADLVSRQFGGESTWQILVKQNAHGPKRNPEPDRARQPPVASRPTGTDRGTGRGSLLLPDSRTAPEPAPACRGKPAYPPRFPGRCGRPTAHQPCDHHTPWIRP